MFVQVRLLNGFSRPLWYRLPESLKDTQQSFLGALLHVPLKNNHVPAVVVQEQINHPNTPFEIRTADHIQAFPEDVFYRPFISKLAEYHRVEELHFIKRIAHFLNQKPESLVEPFSSAPQSEFRAEHLTAEQQTAAQFITQAVDKNAFCPIVLHGVTGSGKTEVYQEVIKHTVRTKKSVIMLLPEVTLATSFEQRLSKALAGEVEIFSFHSAVSAKKKRELWTALIEKRSILIIGVHLPILLPIAHLGAIIVDEEHEVGYQEKKHPRIHTRDAALLRAHHTHIPIILGSATPSISTLYNVRTRNWHYFTLTQRFNGNFPHIKTVLLSDKKQRKNFWISPQLEEAIATTLARQEQCIIFLNRRGFSFFVQCKTCSFVCMCTLCSVSLTLHAHDVLSCHYCGFEQSIPERCPSCAASSAHFIKKGIGTQQVVSILEKLFPQARIARADLDATLNKKKWEKISTDFTQGKLDILVGTQTITKGYDFPKVTLVGIIWADLNLSFPLYNASETTLQQLIQVAGRAGRASKESTVIVQAMADHEIFSHLAETSYLSFYESEIQKRELLSYPPTSRLAQLEIRHPDEHVVEQEAQAIATILFSHPERKEMRILGPARPPVHKIKNIHMRVIYLKSKDLAAIMQLINSVERTAWKSTVLFTPNPVT